jgi:hypothetical protein
MAYAVDFVIDVMERISSSKPVMFQRDGSLFVASQQGFGQVTYGSKDISKIPESDDLVIRVVRDNTTGIDKKKVMSNRERLRVLPILYTPQERSFTLENMINAAKALQELPDDNKIRMLSGGVGYPSHKPGGIDIWVSEARVMNKESYLELIRMNETKMLGAISSLGKLEPKDIPSAYQQLRFPDCVIVTPYLTVSFPRNGVFGYVHRGVMEWSTESPPFKHRAGESIMDYGESNFYSRKDPFGIYVTLNSHRFQPKTAEDLALKAKRLFAETGMNLMGFFLAFDKQPCFIDEINAIHNKACAKEIKRHKEMFPPSRKKKRTKA